MDFLFPFLLCESPEAAFLSSDRDLSPLGTWSCFHLCSFVVSRPRPRRCAIHTHSCLTWRFLSSISHPFSALLRGLLPTPSPPSKITFFYCPVSKLLHNSFGTIAFGNGELILAIWNMDLKYLSMSRFFSLILQIQVDSSRGNELWRGESKALVAIDNTFIFTLIIHLSICIWKADDLKAAAEDRLIFLEVHPHCSLFSFSHILISKEKFLRKLKATPQDVRGTCCRVEVIDVDYFPSQSNMERSMF